MWIMLKVWFFDLPRAVWRGLLEYRRLSRAMDQVARVPDRKQRRKTRSKLPPQFTINDPAVREAEKIVDRFLRRDAKRRRK